MFGLQRIIVLVPAYFYLAFGFALFLSVGDNFLGKAGLLPMAPTLAALLFLVPIFALVLFAELLRRPPLQRFFRVYRESALISIPFTLIAFFTLLCSVYPDAYWGESSKWIFLNVYSYILFLLALPLPLFGIIQKYFRSISLLGLLALCGSIGWDVMYPGTFALELNRAAGFPSNSNWGALSVIMLCAGTLHYKPTEHRLFDTLVLCMSGLAVFFTLSRSGMLNFGLLCLFYIKTVFFTREGGAAKKGVLLTLGILVAVVIFSTVVPYVLQNTQMFANSSATKRIFALLEGKIVDDGSSAGRLGAAEHAIDLIADETLLGHGTGFSRTMHEKPHNLFLQQWVNNGILGLLAYLGLLFGGLRMFSRNRCPRGLGLIIVTFGGSFFSHNILEQRSFLLMLACLSTISILEKNEGKASALNAVARPLFKHIDNARAAQNPT